ncbi:hypothetical protein NSK11_contig00111-0004 [Nocardia seriolae]|uniref:Uncharacterized protein n=1 Tax=Nocardia seriolae TaxID=37332 RepID=A0ABC9Z2I2_9NOCA|nr:hypothetical protein NSERUTF1_3041 [Nocardia seriolae]BEK87534.1 hypothetical protein NSERKGN1266_34850 [Nocardia seriolae]GAM49363.1 hypothetical protein NS07_v2contig00105-0022 [Nocardia seriolae]GAP31328.1 hypothetical protein NSK11_contig00111-0004 [Nocardia seriolae]GEM26985.1 hypothetical protein NS2_52240 [Nocardia seriolae NBRC 15557]
MQPGSVQRSEAGPADEAAPPERVEPPDPAEPPVTDAAAGAGLAATAGAVPHTVQYPSSMVPVQPGSVQFMIASPFSA